MPMRRWTIPILVLLAIAMFVWSQQRATTPVPAALPPTPSTGDGSPTSPPPANAPGASSNSDALPPEVASTLSLIQHSGPFPYRQDGVVFQNREHLLPEETNGYYHEYTVPTPGAGDRGARRIITGGDPPIVYYYTDDHYRSFRTLEVAR
jgi:guanyl-specific ribonuclease Sa